MTDVSAATGTTLGVSAALPATYDSIGYDALTFTDLGEIIDIGEIAKAFNVINHQTVGRAYPQKKKDTFDIANVSLTLGRVSTDAGQVLLQTALDADVSYAFEVVYPSGDTVAFTALVIKNGIGAVASGNFETTMVELAIDPETKFEA